VFSTLLDELAAALGDDANFATTITNTIAAVQSDVDANETASDAAEAALSTRLDTLEADPTTATAVAAVQTDVDANQVTAANAVTAQNTAMLAAVAVVQADVDQNETDADAAIALKANKAGDTFTGDIIIDEALVRPSSWKLRTLHLLASTSKVQWLDGLHRHHQRVR